MKRFIHARKKFALQHFNLNQAVGGQSGIKRYFDPRRPIQEYFPTTVLFDQIECLPAFYVDHVSSFSHFFQGANDALLLGAGKRVELILVPVVKQRRNFIGGGDFVV